MTDIEQALAEALRAVHRRYAMRPGYDELYDPYYEKQDAHAAALWATEPMQAIARQAAIGAAVERLRDHPDNNRRLMEAVVAEVAPAIAAAERERLRAELRYHAGEHQCRITELLLADPEAPTDE